MGSIPAETTMSNVSPKFVLTAAMKKEGFTLVIHWQGGMSSVKTEKGVQKVQKTAQSMHNFNPTQIRSWIQFAVNRNQQNDWGKKSESYRVQEHLEAFMHDLASRNILVSWHVQEAN